MERFDQKTKDILTQLHSRLLERVLEEDLCIGCHSKSILYRENGNLKNAYCSKQCQAGYRAWILPFSFSLGLKEGGEEERPDFTKLLDLLDEPVVAQIIAFTYPHYETKREDMNAILLLREESKQLKNLIDQYILRPVEKLSREITDRFFGTSLSLFPNLKHLELNENTMLLSIKSLTNLETLEISGDILTDDSTKVLVKLTQLILLGSTQRTITHKTFSQLTRLETLVFGKNLSVQDKDLMALPPSLVTVKVLHCPRIHRQGILSFSRLTNLTGLELDAIYVDDSGMGGMKGLKYLTMSNMEKFEGNHDSLGNMRLLEEVILRNCPLFEGEGFRYKSPLRVLLARGTSVSNGALSSQINLTALDITDTKVSDERLSELTNLESLVVRGSEYITDASLSLLTKLKHLDISETKRITRTSLFRLTNLKRLYLNRAEITPNYDDPLLPLYKLKVLSLDSTKAFLPRDMFVLRNLTSLSLANNDTIFGVPYFRNMRNMLQLDLSYNRVIQEEVKLFTKLEIINLTGNAKINHALLKGLPSLKKIILPNGLSVTPSALETQTTNRRRG